MAGIREARDHLKTAHVAAAIYFSFRHLVTTVCDRALLLKVW